VKPSVGCIVHYVSYGTPKGEYTSECRAALITEVTNDTAVALAVLNPTGVAFNARCYLDGDTKPGGTWHWPERVD
jgi:hypothetical protein